MVWSWNQANWTSKNKPERLATQSMVKDPNKFRGKLIPSCLRRNPLNYPPPISISQHKFTLTHYTLLDIPILGDTHCH